MFKIEIDEFKGPFDLLLKLIKNKKLDIYTISLSEIADDFIKEVEKKNFLNMEALSDFIYIGSILIGIKSQNMLLENNEEDKEDEEELKRALIEYKKYKELGIYIKEEINKPYEYFEKYPAEFYEKEELDLSKVNLEEILKYVRPRVLKNNISIKNPIIERKPLNEKIRFIEQYMKSKEECYFDDIIEENKKEEKVVSMLGVLELVSSSELKVMQKDNFDKIKLKALRG